MLGRLWSRGGPTEYGIEVFTEGECWTLAYYLHRIGGWPICTIAPKDDPDWWEHVVVRVGHNTYFDVTGFHTRDALLKAWGGEMTQHDTMFRSWRSFQRELGGSHLYYNPRERSRVMARRLVRKYELA